ncbi:hypothetical protein BDR07DRAFT_859317 [Suillus spraguei]|nr:hypothetical protein BDR07DRAFT_859317 [Suillus spraguei]
MCYDCVVHTGSQPLPAVQIMAQPPANTIQKTNERGQARPEQQRFTHISAYGLTSAMAASSSCLMRTGHSTVHREYSSFIAITEYKNDTVVRSKLPLFARVVTQILSRCRHWPKVGGYLEGDASYRECKDSIKCVGASIRADEYLMFTAETRI